MAVFIIEERVNIDPTSVDENPGDFQEEVADVWMFAKVNRKTLLLICVEAKNHTVRDVRSDVVDHGQYTTPGKSKIEMHRDALSEVSRGQMREH